MTEQQNPTPKRRRRKWVKAFIKLLRRNGNVSKTCKIVEIDRHTVYQFRDQCAEFKAAWEDALVEASEWLEVEATRRAVKGLLRKKFNGKGEPLIDPETGEQYVEREYSDTLLIFLLKGANQQKYRDNVSISQLDALIEAEFRRLAEITAQSKANAAGNASHPPEASGDAGGG